MSYNNFKQTVWATNIEQELDKALVFAENTNREYEGQVENVGDTVKVLGVGRPTVTTVTGSTDISLSAAETVEDTSVTMAINKVTHFNYKVGDIDKAQMKNNLMSVLSSESTYVMADEIDQGVADLAKNVAAQNLWSSAKTDVAKTNILGYFDEGLQKLYENNVRSNTKITATVPPWFWILMKQALIAADTDNSKLLEVGAVGKYGNVLIKLSNNVATDGSSNSLIQLKTDKAIALAIPKIHTEAYRPELKFADAVKGFSLWGTKLVRPEEMVVINCKAAS